MCSYHLVMRVAGADAVAVAIALLLRDLHGDLLGNLVALLDRHVGALLVVSIPVALLLIRGLACRLVGGLVLGLVVGVIDGAALLLIDGLVDSLVGGVALLLGLVAAAMAAVAMAGLRGCGAEA